MTARLARSAAALLALCVSATTARAQAAAPMHVHPELRADVLMGHLPAVQAGAGIQVPAGYYVRIGADVAVGARTGRAADSRVDGRVDLLGRFVLDPFRQSAYGVSAGAGLSARLEPGERVTPLLLVAVDVEGRRGRGGWVPALQLGLGGGARLGLVLRRSDAGAR